MVKQMKDNDKKDDLLDKDFVLEQARLSHDWMLKSIAHNKDEGMYSDELKHAMCVQEMLDVVAGK